MTDLFLELSQPVSDALATEDLVGFSGLVVDGACVSIPMSAGACRCRWLR